MAHFETVEDINGKTADELLRFFREGYSKKFLGDAHFRRWYLGMATSVAMLRDERDEIIAAQIIRNGRMTAGATTSNPTEFRYRRDLMTRLLTDMHTDLPRGWTTINRTSSGMQIAAAQAGMHLLTDRTDVEDRIAAFVPSKQHILHEFAGAIAVALVGSQHGPEHIQYAWGWTEDDALRLAVPEQTATHDRETYVGLDTLQA